SSPRSWRGNDQSRRNPVISSAMPRRRALTAPAPHPPRWRRRCRRSGLWPGDSAPLHAAACAPALADRRWEGQLDAQEEAVKQAAVADRLVLTKADIAE